jgi:thioredoxin 1
MKLNTSNFYDSISDGTVLVKFEASWCGPCKAYTPTYKEFAAENDAVKCFAVDCQDDPDLATDFDIKSIPVTILYKDGEEVNRLSGKLNKDQLKDLVNN